MDFWKFHLIDAVWGFKCKYIKTTSTICSVCVYTCREQFNTANQAQ